jgi:hypothetical protein
LDDGGNLGRRKSGTLMPDPRLRDGFLARCFATVSRLTESLGLVWDGIVFKARTFPRLSLTLLLHLLYKGTIRVHFLHPVARNVISLFCYRQNGNKHRFNFALTSSMYSTISAAVMAVAAPGTASAEKREVQRIVVRDDFDSRAQEYARRFASNVANKTNLDAEACFCHQSNSGTVQQNRYLHVEPFA